MDEHTRASAPGRKIKYVVGNESSELMAHAASVDAVVHAVFAGGKASVVGELWPHLPHVRWVHSLSAGVDALCPVLRKCEGISDIPVSNAKGAFSSSLGEWCLTAMLHFNKQMPRVLRNREERVWDKFIMSELKGRTVGFVGFGSIAQTTAKLCRAFGMQVVALRQRPDGDGAELADKVLHPDHDKLTLFREADFVMCSLPGTPKTKNFCGAPEFAAMKDTAVFISIGRGTCVDEAALESALKKKSIAGAALDVFVTEPLPQENGLWDCDNLILTAHNADNTITYIEDAWKVYLRNFELLCNNEEMPTVDIDLGY